MADWVVIGTSMVVEDEPDAEAAINRAQDMSGWNWEAIPAMNLNPLVHYASLLEEAQEAQDAAYDDSNDLEIDLLRSALEMALNALGLEMPEGHDPYNEEN
jgi:hypothetical protein